MDENFRREINQLSITQIAREAQKRIAPLSHVIETSDSIRRMADYEQMTSATSIANIAMKAFQQANITSSLFESQNVILRHSQLRAKELINLQNSALKMTNEVNSYKNIMSIRERVIQGMGGIGTYEDIMASVDLVKKSLEPLRGSLNTASKALNESEISKLVRELQSSAVIPESTLSEYAGIVKQLESLRNLESFKAISRLENFPNDKFWIQDYDKKHEITEYFLAEVKKLDGRISDEVSAVDDFNDLSENSQRSLEELSLSYYQVFIINYIYIIIILKDQINNSLKYSNMEFRFVGLSSKILVGACFINFQPDFNSICNSILASILLESIKQDEKK